MLTVGVDGSALGNPGPAGWAWYIDDDNWAAGGWEEATNNRGELTAIIKILEATRDTDHDLNILADSQYAINSITKWMAGWKKKGWKKADGKPVVNKDLMIQLDELMTDAKKAGRTITFTWVKGHAGHPLNEAADTRANTMAKGYQSGTPAPSGPGLNRGTPRHLEAPEAHSPTDNAITPEPTDQSNGTVTVHTPLEKTLADRIVHHAQQRGVTPHQELARLIQAGMDALYSRQE